MALDKRAFLLGYFVAHVERKDGQATKNRVNELCRIAGMTPLTSGEAEDLRRFLDFAAGMIEQNARKKGMLKE